MIGPTANAWPKSSSGMLAWPRKEHISSCFCLISKPGLLYTSPYRCVLQVCHAASRSLLSAAGLGVCDQLDSQSQKRHADRQVRDETGDKI